MNIVNTDNMIILTSAPGYLILDKLSGTRSDKMYVNKNANLNNFEEVIDENFINEIRKEMEDVRTKEESLYKIGKIVAKQVDNDEVALQIKEFYEEWTCDIQYSIGEYVLYKDELYKVLSPHVSQQDWLPDVAYGLYVKVLVDPTGETINEWTQPSASNAYMKGDKVRFKNAIYESIIDNNVWSPETYPSGWKLIE